MVTPLISVSAKKPAEEPTLTYSWQESTFHFDNVVEWENDTVSLTESGNYTEVYNVIEYIYHPKIYCYTKINHTITHEANYTANIERIISGNYTVDIDMNAYQVNINYGTGVKLLWFAMKDGMMDWEFYFTKDIRNYYYYEENLRHFSSHHELRDVNTDELKSEHTEVYDVPGVVNTTVSEINEWYPFYEHASFNWDLTVPMILTLQIFNTKDNNRIAWAHMFYNLWAYKDLNNDSILTINDDPHDTELPWIYKSTELFGSVTPLAYDTTASWESNETVYFVDNRAVYPSDKTVAEIASGIEFTPPTETATANVSWAIKYPDFPIHFAEYGVPPNATFNEMTPTNFSYGFDFMLGKEDADLDITWEIEKLTNITAFTAAQGFGLIMPQYNFFLSSFDIDEPEAPFLSIPRDTFQFTSNNSVVAEINMGAGKKFYTLHNSTEGTDDIFPSSGGSIHKYALIFANENSFYNDPILNCLFALRDIVALDTSFTVQDSMVAIETQNYPVWNGEKLTHDPSLVIHHSEPSEAPSGGGNAIPSYNLPLVVGIAGVVMTLIFNNTRNKHKL